MENHPTSSWTKTATYDQIVLHPEDFGDSMQTTQAPGFQSGFQEESNAQRHVYQIETSIPEEDQMNQVYYFPFSCGGNYIGQTQRPKHVRMKDHTTAIRLGMTKQYHSAAHVYSHGCEAQTSKVVPLAQINFKKERETLEALFISVAKNCCSQPSVYIPPQWLYLREPWASKKLAKGIARAQAL